MFKNYLKIALRNIKRHKGYSIINIAGLSVGIACSILIAIFVLDELSYDRYHENADRTYRIAAKGRIGDTEINQAYTPGILAGTLLDSYPEVQQATRIYGLRNTLVRYKDQIFNELNMLATDASIFDVFTFPVIKGNPKIALIRPNTVVVTKTTAKKYFGDEDPIGKVLKFGEDGEFEITAIVEDVPRNSHFHFDFLVSLATFDFSRRASWFNNNLRTYIVLQESVSSNQFGAKLHELVLKYIMKDFDEWSKSGDYWEYFLQPLTDIHLNSDLWGEFEANGNATYVYIFSVIAPFILLIACINFMNLSIAKSANRAKEVGVRKVVGSNRSQLIRQFLIESVQSSIIAVFLGVALVEILLPALRNLLGKHLEMHYFDNLFVLPALIGLALLVGILSGSYPAFYLSSLKPVTVLKGHSPLIKGLWGVFPSRAESSWLRNALVVFQFSVSVILIVCAFVVYKQLNYVQNVRLGFDKSQVVVIRNPQSLGHQIEAFEETLLQHSSVVNASSSSTLPGREFDNFGFIPEGGKAITLNTGVCDYDFLETLQMKMAAGRFFSYDFPSDSSAMVINEAAVNLIGWEEPIGKQISSLMVIGIIEDFHYESMHQKVRPMALLPFPSTYGRENYISVRILTENIPEALNFIHNNWNKFTSNMPFEYSFLDEDYDSLYRNEQQTGEIFTIFSFLAIFIAALGLFGIAAFTAEQRTKEIGVRKVLGASVPNIIQLLSKESIILVAIANILAWPFAYSAMDKWLQDFAYRINIGWWIFVLAGATALVIALLTVTWQAIRAATVNPVESLRYE